MCRQSSGQCAEPAAQSVSADTATVIKELVQELMLDSLKILQNSARDCKLAELWKLFQRHFDLDNIVIYLVPALKKIQNSESQKYQDYKNILGRYICFFYLNLLEEQSLRGVTKKDISVGRRSEARKGAEGSIWRCTSSIMMPGNPEPFTFHWKFWVTSSGLVRVRDLSATGLSLLDLIKPQLVVLQKEHGFAGMFTKIKEKVAIT
jgi:ABC-type transporter MlaC component